jgi:hypothetical protein
MELPEHDLPTLFEQLGLENSDQAIEDFISEHKPIPSDVLLQEADFWSPAQAGFIKEALENDADWAIVVDSLDSRLR